MHRTLVGNDSPTIRRMVIASRREVCDGGFAEASGRGVGMAVVMSTLVVDHEDDGRELLVMALQQHGAQVTALARAADALSFLECVEPHERPQAIVADVRGGADVGLSLVQALLRSPVVGGPIPAIAIISHDHPIERERVHTAGFHGHLSKPLSPRALARTVRSVVGLE